MRDSFHSITESSSSIEASYSQLIAHLSVLPDHSAAEQRRELCDERWVLAVQSGVGQTEAIEALITLLDECGYNPSFGYLAHDSQGETGLYWRRVERRASPFLVLHLPVGLSSDGATSLHIHTLTRETGMPNHFAGATLDPLCKLIGVEGDAMFYDEGLGEVVGQIEQLAHNDHKNIPLSQQLAISAAHHVGVMPEVALGILGIDPSNA